MKMKVRYEDKWYEAIQASYDYTTSRWWYNIIDQPDTDPLHTEWVTNAAEEQPKMPTYWSENKDINQNKKKMTQKEFDLRMQELRLQYTKENNEINRWKQDVQHSKIVALNNAYNEFREYKRIMSNKIYVLMADTVNLDKEDPKREMMQAEKLLIRNDIENRYNDLKAQNNVIEIGAHNDLMRLDEKQRKLKKWYEEERLKAMQELAATAEQEQEFLKPKMGEFVYDTDTSEISVRECRKEAQDD